MKNIAVVIADADYVQADPLPACAKDGEAVADVLRASGRFDTFVIRGDKDAGVVKAELMELIEASRGQKVGQFFSILQGMEIWLGTNSIFF